MPKQSSTRCTLKTGPTASRSKKRTRTSEPRNAVVPTGELSKDYSDLARILVLASWPAIVQGLITKAIAGGYQQTKLLLDLCALTNVDASHLNDDHKQQLCDALLEGLKFTTPATDESRDGTDKMLDSNETPLPL